MAVSAGAIFSLFHDIIIVGFYAVMGHFHKWNSIFGYHGYLTVLGYSVNDTIVVYDRIRENI